MPVLKIRDADGNFIPIKTIRGEDGKSAYEQAVAGGYKASEEEFIALLNGLTASEDADHYADFNNPHKVTKEQLGIGNVDNTADADKPLSNPQATALQETENNLLEQINLHTNNLDNPHGVTAEQIGAVAKTEHTIFDTGNKPFGTYEGNGSSTERQIQIGGIGNNLLVTSSRGMYFAHAGGASTWSGSSTSKYTADLISFVDGVLKIKGTASILNGSGVEYTYTVL